MMMKLSVGLNPTAIISFFLLTHKRLYVQRNLIKNFIKVPTSL